MGQHKTKRPLRRIIARQIHTRSGVLRLTAPFPKALKILANAKCQDSSSIPAVHRWIPVNSAPRSIRPYAQYHTANWASTLLTLLSTTVLCSLSCLHSARSTPEQTDPPYTSEKLLLCNYYCYFRGRPQRCANLLLDAPRKKNAKNS